MKEEFYNIGKIVNTHGIRGDVKVLRITDFSQRFAVGEKVYVQDSKGQLHAFVIDEHRVHKGFDLLHFEGVNNINDVEQFKGNYIKIAASQQTALEEGEYYYHEIIGCEVFRIDSGEKIGIITEILSPGANDVWVVKQPRGKEILIPYIDDIVKQVNPGDKKVIIEPMEGLLD
ncbi:ribosome maturation factor RimM [Virgibacillus sp. 179-BFC.A HS]|uniref:Ribosome maturation factor RimM n=1 Tax=Tigheibacillus jepli TaxID=3035914 RepID=A0ABU5CHV0_9BACI|nr:ribosome maturation factor RimM [Virgibacillus sp. 179-BFC.A HS]MDY0405903.1 ribosome maturation factor RimM [Virgibacillus sp. 179-BFC.A HS]